MDWIDQLQNVDTTSVDGQPMTAESIMHEQRDIVTEFNHVEEILANAPASKHHMFMVSQDGRIMATINDCQYISLKGFSISKKEKGLSGGILESPFGFAYSTCFGSSICGLGF